MKSLLKSIVSALFVLTILVSAVPARAQGLSHSVEVYIDTSDMGNASVWAARIQPYFDEVNTLIANATGGLYSLQFDTVNGIRGTSTEPWTTNGPAGCNYQNAFFSTTIWFTHNPPQLPNNAGYTRGVDCAGNGTIVINTLHALANQNFIIPAYPPALSSDPNSDYYAYWHIVIAIAHEFVHTQGGFTGGNEAYNYDNVVDNSGAIPALNISLTAPNDPWWSGAFGTPYPQHTGMIHDPMGDYVYNNILSSSWADERANVVYSPLSAHFLSGAGNIPQFRNTTTTCCGTVRDITTTVTSLKFVQLDAQGQPVSRITISGWWMSSGTQAFTGTTRSDGAVTTTWVPRMSTQVAGAAMVIKSYNRQGGQYGAPIIIDAYNVQMCILYSGAPACGSQLTFNMRPGP